MARGIAQQSRKALLPSWSMIYQNWYDKKNCTDRNGGEHYKKILQFKLFNLIQIRLIFLFCANSKLVTFRYFYKVTMKN